MKKILSLLSLLMLCVVGVNAEKVIYSWPSDASQANSITLAEGVTVTITGNSEKKIQNGNKITIGGTEYTSMKVSNGAQNTLTLPKEAVGITFYSYVNKDAATDRVPYWKEVAGVEYTEETSGGTMTSYKNGANPDVRSFSFEKTKEVTFTNTGEQLCYVMEVEYAEEGSEVPVVNNKTIGLVPGVWAADGATFAAYAFNSDTENAWFPFVEASGAYGTQVPDSYAKIILVRLKPATAEGFSTENYGLNWTNKWNQTDDIDFTAIADKTVFTITGYVEGGNSTYTTGSVPADLTELKATLQKVVNLAKMFGYDTTQAETLIASDKATAEQLTAALQALATGAKDKASEALSQAKAFFEKFDATASANLAPYFNAAEAALAGTDIDAMLTAAQTLTNKIIEEGQSAIGKVDSYLRKMENETVNKDLDDILAALQTGNLQNVMSTLQQLKADITDAATTYLAVVSKMISDGAAAGKDVSKMQTAYNNILTVAVDYKNGTATLVEMGVALYNLIKAVENYKEANTTYTIAGTKDLTGTEEAWQVVEANNMTLDTESSLYTWTAENITVTAEAQPQFKVVITDIDGKQTWVPASDESGDHNWVITPDYLGGEGVYNITITYNVKTQEIGVTGVKAETQGEEDPELVAPEGWTNAITNGNLAGDDVTSYVAKEYPSTDILPATIVAGAGKNGSRGILVKTADDANAEPQAWDSQFWILLPEEMTENSAIHVEFDYKASQEAKASTQVHTTPGSYLYHSAIGDVNFTTDWKHFSTKIIVTAEMAGMKSIAFNLQEEKSATDYQFDNFGVWYKKGEPITDWTDIIVNGDMEGNDPQCFYVTEQGVGGPFLAKFTEGIGKDGSKAVKVQSADEPANKWDTQFFIRLPYQLPAGAKYKVSFDYKADKAGDFDTQAHTEPSGYIHWDCIGTGSFTTDWQTFEAEGTITGDMSKEGQVMQTIAFDLANNKVATEFIFDNVKFEVPTNYLSILTTNTSTDYAVTFTTNAGWEEVYAYAWSGEGDNVEKTLGAWPGTKIEANEGVYNLSFKTPSAPEKIIFNNGGNGAQTADLDFENGKAYEFTINTEWADAIAAAQALVDEDGVAVGKLIAAIGEAQGIAEPSDEQKAALQKAVDQYKLDNADQEKDETAKVATNGWKKFDGSAAGVCATQYAPAITTYDGRTAQMAECYEGNGNRTGTIIYQDITGLTNGKYKVGFYGNAFSTSQRDGFECTMEDGATDVAYVFANEEKEYISARIATSTTENDFRQFDVEVTDGNIKLGMGKDTEKSTNWHTIQIYQLTWFTTAKEVFAQDQEELKAVIAEAKALLADETKTEGKEALEFFVNAAEQAVDSKMINISELEAVIGNLKALIAGFKKANWYIDLTAGDYYIIDVESGLKMAAGHDWGTRGIVNELGLDLTLTPYTESRTVTIDSRVYNGDTSHFLGENLYMDSSEWGWALEYQGFGFYILEPNGGKYINLDKDNNLVLSDTPREFIIVTKDGVMAQRMAELEIATKDAPVDATFLIKANNFNRGDARNAEAWIVSEDCTNKNLSGGNNVNNCAESYHSTFTIMQTISGAPAGLYQLTAQGFYRQDEFEGDAPAAPMFFANEVNQDVPAMGDLPDHSGNGKNGMDDASVEFTNGNYTIEPINFEVKDDGMMYIGITASTNTQWVIWDNFQLTYFGKDDTTTGIATVNTSVNQNGTIYNLAGQKVTKAQKGLYIVNGRKQVVR